MKIHNHLVDIPLLAIGLLLVAILIFFFLGIFPYPFGLLILSILFFSRYISLQHKDR